jgi:anaerobic selenocysteine-containing dehydrogenase
LDELESMIADEASRSSGNAALTMISRRQLRSNNSWMHNVRVLMKGAERCTLLMHPDDAAERGIGDASTVRVVSDVGSVSLTVEVTDEIRRGVVSMPHGWGHDVAGTRLGVASQRPGANVNAVIDAKRLDRLSGNAALSGASVVVEPLTAPAAAVAALIP